MDLLTRKVTRNGREITLTPREFQILEFFLRRKNRVVSRTMLLEGVWDYHFDPNTNVVDVHISKLRRQLDEGGEPPLRHKLAHDISEIKKDQLQWHHRCLLGEVPCTA